MKKVMAFGVFDGLHDGHRYFLREAKKHGDYCIAVVARDSAVQEIKHRLPRDSAETRAKAIRDTGLADLVVIGDETQGSWEILRAHKPDVIALGFDQAGLREELEVLRNTFTIELVDITQVKR